MRKKNNILKLFFSISIFTSFVLVLANLDSLYKYSDTSISIQYFNKDSSKKFSELDIIHTIQVYIAQKDSITKDINTNVLEDLISENKYVKKAEVYLGVDDSINVLIHFREPYVKILENKKINYYDYDLQLLPFVVDCDSKLLVISGDINMENYNTIYKIVEEIYNNKMLNNCIGGLYYDENLGYTLSSKICDLKISIGHIKEFTYPLLKKIEMFSLFVAEKLGCDYCDEINLNFDNQIICIK